MTRRRDEADAFYGLLHPASATTEERRVQRTAWAGLIWSKQLYYYDVGQWLRGGTILSAVVAACCSVEEDALAASSHALAILGCAGELAASEASGPASFRTGLIDRLYNLDEAGLDAGARIQ